MKPVRCVCGSGESNIHDFMYSFDNEGYQCTAVTALQPSRAGTVPLRGRGTRIVVLHQWGGGGKTQTNPKASLTPGCGMCSAY